MQIILERYTNKDTGLTAFKRLVVIENTSGLFEVVKEIDYGQGAGVTVAKMPLKAYKTRKGAEKAMKAYQPPRYQMTVVEGLMSQGKI